MKKNHKVRLHTNQALLVKELRKRKIKVTLLDGDLELLEAVFHSHREFICDRFSSIFPYTLTTISANKILTKELLKRQKIAVPLGQEFYSNEKEMAIKYAQKLGFPVVLKPNYGSHGDHIFSDLCSPQELVEAINDYLKQKNDSFIVEEYFEGKEYRVFITAKGDMAVLNRDPASVIGDGVHTITQLAHIESQKRTNPRTDCLCPIVINDSVIKNLQKQKINLDTIPQKAEKIYLTKISNVAKGGMCEDATDLIHPSVKTIAFKIMNLFKGMPYLGFDLLSKDITKKQTPNTYRVLEVNSNPGFTLHMFPGKGKSRNVAKLAVDLMFPETA